MRAAVSNATMFGCYAAISGLARPRRSRAAACQAMVSAVASTAIGATASRRSAASISSGISTA